VLVFLRWFLLIDNLIQHEALCKSWPFTTADGNSSSTLQTKLINQKLTQTPISKIEKRNEKKMSSSKIACTQTWQVFKNGQKRVPIGLFFSR